MKKINLFSTPYFFYSMIFLFLFALNGCARCPSETRYDTVHTYSAPVAGVRYTVGKYDRATAVYTLRQQNSGPHSQAIRTASGSSENQTTTLILEVTDVLFDFDKWVIKAPYLPELDTWVSYFMNNPQVTAGISGHTDSIGRTSYNQKLSEKRAQAVVNYLVKNGVEVHRLKVRGFGELQPIASNSSSEGRQKNRRVEANF